MTDGASRPPSPFAEFAYKDGAAFVVDDDDDDESLRSLTPVSPASPFSASPACRPAAARPPPRPASLIKRKASPLEVLAAYAPPAAPLPPCPALEPACLPTIVPSTEWRLDDAWKDALWTISQSNIVIGGTSSFFALGAHLCSQCTVVTIKSHPKFRAHRFEKTTHHNLQQLKLR